MKQGLEKDQTIQKKPEKARKTGDDPEEDQGIQQNLKEDKIWSFQTRSGSQLNPAKEARIQEWA